MKRIAAALSLLVLPAVLLGCPPPEHGHSAADVARAPVPPTVDGSRSTE